MRVSLSFVIIPLLIISCVGKSEPSPKINFQRLKLEETGIEFNNKLHYNEDFNIFLYRSFYNGAGVGMGDFNNDGLQDIFFCGNQVDNKLYLNLGDFKFKDITEAAGLVSSGSWSTGVSIVDVNADGWLDIYVCKSGNPETKNRRNELFINSGRLDANGVPRFLNEAAEWGIDDLGLSVNATFFDFDRDGDLDIYLLNNSITPTEIVLDAKKGLRNIYDEQGGNKLYENIGNKYIDITKGAGIYGSAIGFGLGLSIGDVNKDGWDDIYVANDFFEKDYLYYNNKDGTFTEALEQSMNEISQGSMGVDIADLNNDGLPEIFVTEMLPYGNERLKTKIHFDSWDTYMLRLKNGYYRQFPRNTLQLNQGLKPFDSLATFTEVSRFSNTAASEWSWGVHILDLDNDLQKEIFVTNGIVKDLFDQDYVDFYSDPIKLNMIYKEKGAVIKELVDNLPSVPISNHLYEMDENMHFTEVAKNWGLADPSFSTGAAFGDLDNDGDLDLVINNLEGEPFIYKNNIDKDKNYINITLKDNTKNTMAIGSKVTVYVGQKTIFQESMPVRGTMSTMDNRLSFGLGDYPIIDSIQIQWPQGEVSKLYNIASNQFLTIDKSEVKVKETSNKKESKLPLYTDVTNNINIDHLNEENDYLDFNRDQLRYSSIATEGPKLAVGDVNQDGKLDLFVCGAANSPSALFLSEGNNSFKKINQGLFELDKLSEDTNAIFVDIDSDDDLDLLVSSGGYQYPSSSYALANRIYINDGSGNFKKSSQSIPSSYLSNTSCIVPADIDLDGDMDLFIGNRAVPLNYGLPDSSFMLINDGTGKFTDKTSDIVPGFKDLGLVTSAKWFDYDNDDDLDLIVVGEWMSLHLYENVNGKLKDISEEVGLDKTKGLWNSVEVSDLDGDGYVDIVAGNLGENSFFKGNELYPVTLLINDFDGNGEIDHIYCSYEDGKLYPMATKKDISKQMPYLLKRYLKHTDYSNQTIQDIFTNDQLSKSIKLTANQMASSVFWNNKNQFTESKLPYEAQLSPIYAILLEDIDEDGIVDILLGGNLYTVKPQMGIYAGSQGAFLKGKGGRTFETMAYSKSGLYFNGEVRDIKLLPIEKNKSLILVARNNDDIEIFEKSH